MNELRLSEFDDQGGWAAQGEVQLALSDIGTIHFSGRKETAGFGALSHQLMQRRSDDYESFHFTVNMELGRFLPKQAKISAPIYYSYSNQYSSPLYDPFNKDILLDESLHHISNPIQRDSLLQRATTRSFHKSFSLSNVKADIRSKNPMPYDPANFSFTYADNLYSHRDPETVYTNTRYQRLQANYLYTPRMDPWQPFKSPILRIRPLPNQLQLRSNLARRYQERRLRDFTPPTSQQAGSMGETTSRYLSFASSFFWDRDFSFAWDLSEQLKASFRSGTVAEIEEPYLQVNKKINRDDYEIWRDSVAHNIRKLGTPYRYEQSADVTYTLPFSYLSALDWINASAAYHSRYRWERGARIEEPKIGNYLQNDLSMTLNGRFNLVALYNKNSFFRDVNTRFSNQGNRGGFGLHLARVAMMVRSVSINFSHKTRTDIPGFDPMIGDLFGQQSTSTGLVPGLGFAFGLEGGERFIERSLAEGRLVIRSDHITPALFNKTGLLRMDATLEPFRGLTVELQALYEDNRRTEFQYMVEGMPKTYGGSFAMSTIALSSAFENARADNNYQSKAFERFLAHKEIITARMDARYRPFVGEENRISSHSSDVLIPAFLAAYTGRDPKKSTLSVFPNVRALLPNWGVTYNLMTLLPELQDHLRSLFLSHNYRSQYRIGSYSSFQNWEPLWEGSELGLARDPVSGLSRPSSLYDISSATLIESFNPLLEVNSMLHNHLNISLRLNRTRALNLNIGSQQLVETFENDVVAGLGYRLAATRFSKETTLRLDVSRKITRSLIRKIEDGFTQATSGMKSTTVRFTADYALSSKLTLRAYYDTIIHRPLVSSFAYPHSVSNAGINLRMDLL